MSTPRRFSQGPYVQPPGSTEIVLVRHGASADAVEGEDFDLFEGHGNPALSPIGREQAELVGQRLAREKFAALYVSNLRRTSETAAPLIALSGMVPIVEPDIREVFLGEWEGGILRQKAVDHDPIFLKIWEEQSWAVVPGAEASDVFSARLRGAIERIAAAHVDQKVVVFSHGAAIGDLMAQASGSRPFAFIGVDNASINRLVITPERWAVRCYNDTAHLAS
jgi:2,3-bisphosphoglycerate-dependent phosphoglycerate mutase